MRREENANVIVVTRFHTFAQFLVDEGHVPHGTPHYDGPVPLNVIKGAVVYGYLPTFLASHAKRYIEMDLGRIRISPNDEPSLDLVRKNARLTAYEIRRVET